MIHILHWHVNKIGICKELEDLAHAVTDKKIEALNLLNTLTLWHKGKGNKYFPSCYQKRRGKRKVNEEALSKSRQAFVQRKANKITKHVSMDNLDLDIQQQILKKITDNHDFILINQEAHTSPV